MATFQTVYGVNHRRQQSLLLVLSLFALLLSIVPRQERALFVVSGRPLKAFGVAIPPVSLDDIAYTYAPRGPFAPRAFFARQPNRPGVVGTPDALGPAAPFAPADSPPGTTGAAPDGGGTPANAVTSSAGPAGAGTGGGVPFFPTTLTPPSSDPVGTIPAAAVTPVAVVPGVPEPSTWLMMIAGLGLMGAVLRFRRNRSHRQSNAI